MYISTVVNGPPDSPSMTLSAMAGDNGAALAGAVMNTVQTGSVPSETAGQPGNPNTGSSAGDATGNVDLTRSTFGALYSRHHQWCNDFYPFYGRSTIEYHYTTDPLNVLFMDMALNRLFSLRQYVQKDSYSS